MPIYSLLKASREVIKDYARKAVKEIEPDIQKVSLACLEEAKQEVSRGARRYFPVLRNSQDLGRLLEWTGPGSSMITLDRRSSDLRELLDELPNIQKLMNKAAKARNAYLKLMSSNYPPPLGYDHTVTRFIQIIQ